MHIDATNLRCFSDDTMYKGFNYIFNSSLYDKDTSRRALSDGMNEEADNYKFPTFERCQDPSSLLVDGSKSSTKNAKKEGSKEKHIE